MTKPNGTPKTEPSRRRRLRRSRHKTVGVVAQYIHELSERHAEDARARKLAPAVSPGPSG